MIGSLNIIIHAARLVTHVKTSRNKIRKMVNKGFEYRIRSKNGELGGHLIQRWIKLMHMVDFWNKWKKNVR